LQALLRAFSESNLQSSETGMMPSFDVGLAPTTTTGGGHHAASYGGGDKWSTGAADGYALANRQRMSSLNVTAHDYTQHADAVHQPHVDTSQSSQRQTSMASVVNQVR